MTLPPTPTPHWPDEPKLRLRIVFGPQAMLGPGKADLLEAIRETGSISAAGRRLGMSYKRAWSLVEILNGVFRDPLVESARGGPRGGGARLTEAGETVLSHYRAIETRIAETGATELRALVDMLADMSGEK